LAAALPGSACRFTTRASRRDFILSCLPRTLSRTNCLLPPPKNLAERVSWRRWWGSHEESRQNGRLCRYGLTVLSSRHGRNGDGFLNDTVNVVNTTTTMIMKMLISSSFCGGRLCRTISSGRPAYEVPYCHKNYMEERLARTSPAEKKR
jgi:hypothetical protein